MKAIVINTEILENINLYDLNIDQGVVFYRAQQGAICVLMKFPSETKWCFKSLNSPSQNGESFTSESGRESIIKAIKAGRSLIAAQNQKELAKYILSHGK